MKQTAKFWDKHAAKYALSPIKDQAAYDYTLERTRSYLKAQHRALEIGSGTGSTALRLAGNVAQYTGTDISPEMIRIATEKVKAAGVDNLRFRVCSAGQSAQEAAGVDVVMGFNILHLTEDLQGILGSLHRNLAPDGLLITKTPCLGEPSIGVMRVALRVLIPVMQFFRKAPFVQTLSFKQLETMITEAGFKIVETATAPKMSRYIVARRA
ncbi:class I SAM-dependent methyltransferase [Sulfitobacter sp. F26204]|uniref:class I SAM-dependent methyltransferase n=1 Tax=Sulfitobacter sp. F26204 TaxID=2996014 RepID=UPI00225E1BAD|nr:class I SAM-dependent methyltransferase [Sulfitobacter sp. F26204]MCX7558546.1 class I SAM-dependent methyltransferase [Sulfitobacter sp. F26204]